MIKIGGSTLEDIGRLSALWGALVKHADRPEACTTVLVHGGGKAVDAMLGRLGMPVERRDGLRVTPVDQVGVIAGVLAGTVNKQLVGAINAAGGRAVGLCLGDGSMVECRQMAESLGHVGEVVGGEGAVLRTLLAGGFMPVVSSIGIDAAGGLLNVNADDAAAGIARGIGASRLVLLTDVPGIKGADGVLRPTLSASQIEAMIAGGEITGGMIVKARSAVAAARSTGSSVVIMSGESPEALMRFLAGEPVGTIIGVG